MIKYANNAFLASKISLANDLANICKEFGVDSASVGEHRPRRPYRRRSSGAASAGVGCFPKDTAAIIAAARAQGYDTASVAAAVDVNDGQPERLLSLIETTSTAGNSALARVVYS